MIDGLTTGDAFFNRLGLTVAEKTFCASGSSTAWIMTVGPTGGVDPESFAVSNACRDGWGALKEILDQRRVRTLDFRDWLAIDAAEREQGAAKGKPREKFTRVEEACGRAAPSDRNYAGGSLDGRTCPVRRQCGITRAGRFG